MKKKLTNNLALKLLSLLIATIVWLIIVNVADPTKTLDISNIPVTVINDETLLDAGKCYNIVSESEVNITVKGKKSMVDKLNASDFEAIADMRYISMTNSVPVNVVYKSKLSVEPEIVYGKSNSILVELDDFETKSFNLELERVGNVTTDYYISDEEVNLSTNKVKVSGPKQIISNIDKVVAEVDVSDITEPTNFVCSIKTYDNNGNTINSSRLSYSKDSINVSVNPLIEKTVNIKVKTTGLAPSGYVFKKISSDISSIKIAGESAAVAEAGTITLTTDISKIKNSTSVEYDLMNYISSNVKLVSAKTVANVSVDMEELITKRFTFEASKLKFVNLQNDVITNYDSNKSLVVVVRGMKDVLDDVTIDTLAPHIDVDSLSLGKQNTKILFEELDGVEIVSIPSIEIELVDKESIVNKTTPAPTSAAPKKTAAPKEN